MQQLDFPSHGFAEVTVPISAEMQPVDIELEPGRFLEGKVIGEDGAPIPFATVVPIVRTESRTMRDGKESVRSIEISIPFLGGKDGAYRIGLPQGNATVRTFVMGTPPGFVATVPLKELATTLVNVPKEGGKLDINVKVIPETPLTVLLADEKGNGVPYASVRVTGISKDGVYDKMPGSAVADAKGIAVVSRVAKGKISIYGISADGKLAAIQILDQWNPSSEVTLKLEKVPSCKISFLSEDNEPLEGMVYFYVGNDASQLPWPLGGETINKEDEFRAEITGLVPNQDYYVAAQPRLPGYTSLLGDKMIKWHFEKGDRNPHLIVKLKKK